MPAQAGEINGSPPGVFLYNLMTSENIVLSDEQNRVLADMDAGKNLLITGPGGTGKSLLLKEAQRIFNDTTFAVCGSTGVAAVNVGGSTLHSWCGIGLGGDTPENLAQMAMRNKPALNRIRFTEVMALDEISMISAELLDKVDMVFQIIRKNERPFGGMQMILFGDFLQLPPVEGGFAFKAKCWDKAAITVHVLTKVFRQQDELFAATLGLLREGILTEKVKVVLRPRLTAVDPNPEIAPVYLTPLNREADEINARKLRYLPGEAVTFSAEDKGTPSGLRLLEKCPIPAKLSLKIGSRVMCCYNMDPHRGIVNGTTGTVLSMVPAESPYTVPSVDVVFDNGEYHTISPYQKELSVDGKITATRKQIPLRPAHAVSIHKSQGLTLDKVEAHLRQTFEPGQTYVALSRVRTLEGLFLKGFNRENVSANPEALAFYRKNSKTAAV